MITDRTIFLTAALTGAVFAMVCSYLLTHLTAFVAERVGAVDKPTGGRKIHTRSIPLFGGVGIAVTILVGMGLLAMNELLPGISGVQLAGFAVAIVILTVGGMIDDRYPLTAGIQLAFPLLAAVTIVASGTGIIQVTNLVGHGAFSLRWWSFGPDGLSFPADILTIFWLLFATYATKLMDGLDGLVAGLAAIGASMVGALTISPAYFQPGVVCLAATVSGAYLGFLPRNIHPAKQFLGEAGSTLAGFTLGFLAIVSSAKVAIALAVLAIPLVDAGLIVLGRLRRGKKPWIGDDTHLHFRLLRAGVPYRTAVALLWAAAFAAGLLALGLQTRGKVFLVLGLAMLTVFASWLLNRHARKKKKASK
ncbi:undecaprenyl/decaprenyl-phosphate alpha-N-acetylglucosaminyl 1-phosphate transferase [Patescibacteria group bacterium]|nr:undecaprenyl/decaprenyl-phosphate alpha-N-acetylglucosaminyl 1-phosphate transferase [Patescibacteria group bacterium]MBU1448518.1 undecaprenyl/decaprenyl-phosphate alpha-N-acetylglucosaminyl 1-phosphate transferase [Patescibacteria group bacterium]